jgi:hypothetical protein
LLLARWKRTGWSTRSAEVAASQSGWARSTPGWARSTPGWGRNQSAWFGPTPEQSGNFGTYSPHTADTEQMTRPLLADRITENVQRLAAGRELAGQVDPDLGY